MYLKGVKNRWRVPETLPELLRPEVSGDLKFWRVSCCTYLTAQLLHLLAGAEGQGEGLINGLR